MIFGYRELLKHEVRERESFSLLTSREAHVLLVLCDLHVSFIVVVGAFAQLLFISFSSLFLVETCWPAAIACNKHFKTLG